MSSLNEPVPTPPAEAQRSDSESFLDLSDQAQAVVVESDRFSFHRGWAWLVLVENRLSSPPPSNVATLQLLVKGNILIGSNVETCDVLLTSGRISREHAEIEFDFAQGQFWITDRDSTNGTFVRTSGGSEIRVIARQPLFDGCRIRLADDAVFVFRCFANKAIKP